MTRHERHTSVSCLFVRDGKPSVAPREPYRRIGHLLHVATYARTELDNKCESRCSQILKPEWTHVLVLFNPVAERRSTEYATDFEDKTIEELIRSASTDNEYLPRNQFGDRNIKLVGYSRTSIEAWSMLEALLRHDAYLELRSRYLDVANRALCPFPVIKELGGFSLAATTQLVWFAGRHAVCKCLSEAFEHHFNRKRVGMEVAAEAGVGAAVLEVGPNWIVMEYLSGHRQVRTKWYGLVPLNTARLVFTSIKRLHEHGIMMMDLKFENCLVNGSDVRIIDFETSLRYEKPVPPFDKNPLFTWRRFLDHGKLDEGSSSDPRVSAYTKSGPYITYNTNWKPHVGLNIDELLNSRPRTGLKRMHHLLTRKLPRYVAQKIGRAHSGRSGA